MWIKPLFGEITLVWGTGRWGESIKPRSSESSISMEMEKKKSKSNGSPQATHVLSWGYHGTKWKLSVWHWKEEDLRDMFASCQSCHESSEPKQRSNARGYSLLSETYLPLRAELCHVNASAGRTRHPRCSPGLKTSLTAPKMLNHLREDQNQASLWNTFEFLSILVPYWSQLVTENRNQPGTSLHFQSPWVKLTSRSSWMTLCCTLKNRH